MRPSIFHGLPPRAALVAGYRPYISSIIPCRHRSTFFSRKKRPSNAQIARPNQNVIFEQDAGASASTASINDVKHYLRTTEVPAKLRRELLRSKTTALVESTDDSQLSEEWFKTVDSVVSSFQQKDGQIDAVLETETLYMLFNKTAHFYLSAGRRDFPPFMAMLAQHFLNSSETLTTPVLLNLVIIGGGPTPEGLASSLAYISAKKRSSMGASFSGELVEVLRSRGSLTLDTFDTIASVSGSQKQGGFSLVNEPFVKAFVGHVERTFESVVPDVHEYLDSERNFYKVQYVANNIIKEYLRNAQTETLLNLLKLKTDLNGILAGDADKDTVNTILMHLRAHGAHNNYSDIKKTLFAQNLNDEALCECLLTQLPLQGPSFESFTMAICEFIVADDVKFSADLRLRSKLILHSTENKESEIEPVRAILQPFLGESEDIPVTFLAAVQAIVACNVPGDLQLIERLYEVFNETAEVEPSVDVYRLLIDTCIRRQDPEKAYELFEESITTSSVQWTESVDPNVDATLNRLIASLATTEKSIMDVFPQFRKIKQHMNGPCSAETLTVMAQKMLHEECVGDVIEMLKRELPKIEKDSYSKIRVDLPFQYAHRQLFYLLQDFVTSYTNEVTFETNWVLYGELHKYFHIPYETYLPTIQFFCDKNRLNAALLIVRRMKMLSELHARNNINQPPSREIYMYLLQTFGDRFYEEGVVEVHEYLNLDVNLQSQDIGLQNCLLNAYSNLQDVGKARDLFLAISSNSKEHGGINEETVQIMIKAYTYGGMSYVQKFWDNLSQFGIFPDYSIFKQYVIALSYHGFIEQATKAVEQIDEYNIEFSSDLLLAMHNYCLDADKQQEVAEWAIENHKEEWENLQQSGLLRSAGPYMPEGNLLVSGES